MNKIKKTLVLVVAVVIAVTSVPFRTEAKVTEKKNPVVSTVSCNGASIIRPVIIKLNWEGNDKDGYTKISLRLSAPYRIAYYRFNGKKIEGNGKKVIDLKNITVKTANAKVGRNTIYVYDKRGTEGSWAFKLKQKAPIIKIREGDSVKGKKKGYYQKIAFTFKGEGIIEYGFNNCCDEFEEPLQRVAFLNVTKKTKNCHKGKNKIWIFDEKLEQGASVVFYLE